MDAASRKLLSQVEPGGIAEKEIRDTWRDTIRNAGHVENLIGFAEENPTGQYAMEHFDTMGDDTQAVMDIMNGNGAQVFPDTIEEFMTSRFGAIADRSRTEVADLTDPSVSPDMRMLRAALEVGGGDSVDRRSRGYAESLEDYLQLTNEVATILHAADAARDPATRLKMNGAQFRQLASMVQNLDQGTTHAQQFLSKLREQGLDTTALEAPLREVLDKHGMADLMDAPPDVPEGVMNEFLIAGNDYMQKRQRDVGTSKEAVATVRSVADVLKASRNPARHHQLSAPIRMIVKDEIIANGGSVPDALAKVLRDPVFETFGAFGDVLARLDIDELIKSGDVDLRTATNDRYANVEWEVDSAVSAEHVVDDRGDEIDEYADESFDKGMAQVTPNVGAALNSLFTSIGGGIHRTKESIAEASTPDAEQWRNEGWDRSGAGGADDRNPYQVEGVYVKGSNTVIVADQRVAKDSWRATHVVPHELGHALDSMLGETYVEGGWFTNIDKEFKKAHKKLKQAASYGRSPEQSLLYWYFRNSDEGAAEHNGNSGDKEVFAEGYAAYAAAREQLAQLPDVQKNPAGATDGAYLIVGRALSLDTAINATEWLSLSSIKEKQLAMGKVVYEYFDALENVRLAKIMDEPKMVGTQSEFRNALLAQELGAPPTAPVQHRAAPSQIALVSTHNSKTHGVIQMEHIEPGTPEWDAKLAEIKANSPGAALPPPAALYVTFNPDYQEQGASLIWKAVMPNKKDPSYEYTDEHKATQLAAKFQRQKKVHEVIGTVRTAAEAEALYDETAAAVLALIETGARVASDEKAGTTDRKTGKKVTTFGTSTMLKKHVFFPSPTLMRFKYQGKANKANTYETRNPVLIAAVKQLLEGKGPSDQVFANTNSNRAIQYLREKSGMPDIINHDTRTDYATSMAHDLVSKVPKSKMPKNAAALKKIQNEISKKVGLAINDTPAVAKASYISPAVWIPLEHTAGVAHEFEDSPPYGLVEGDVVQSIGGPAVPGQPPAQGGEAPPVPVAAAAEPPEEAPVEEGEPTEEVSTGGSAEPETYQMDLSDEAAAERDEWYQGFMWPDPPIVAGPDPEALAEEESQVQAEEQEPEE